MKKYFIAIIVITNISFAQTDWVKWEAKTITYQVGEQQELKSRTVSGFGTNTVAAAKKVSKFLFSDLDGDNCPFNPSCSSFFVESVKETNIFQGTLMLADRLTRDTNFFNRQHHYPFAANGRLYDVPSNYKLNTAEIKYYPPYASVNDE